MKKLVIIVVFALFIYSFTSLVHGEEKNKVQGYFDVNITGYRLYVLDDFVELINEEKVTSYPNSLTCSASINILLA